MAQLSIKKAIKYAVTEILDNPWYFVKLLFAWLGISLLLIVSAVIVNFTLAAYISLRIIGLLFLFLYIIGLFIWFLPAKLLLEYHDNGPQPFSMKSMFQLFDFKILCKLLAAIFLYYLIVTAGLILLIIPGFYIAIKLILAFLEIIDTQCGIIQAFKRSYDITTGNFWRIVALIIIASLLVHLLITIPVSLLMMIHAYRQLEPKE